ncbi:MAG: DNA gyrase subunit A [Proteobacteria bacterium]|nr:DNA gyrase subunit A [Pseudomonadota bacterium]
MKKSYLDYAMSVIVSRALPDVRDGLKPVHRRILYSMFEQGYEYNKPYRKSARIVGDVMGKYHPHGDSSIYDALVRMAQDFSLRLPLVDGQGNFGSMDGDPPAAMRYTEARLSKAASSLLDDINKDTVDFQANYDESEHEPKVLPARFPNLLANGASGIAVGMATNIPPHNLGEVCDAALALIKNSELSNMDLMEWVKGPDFPTGAIILGTSGIRSALETGRGSITIRSKSHIEEVRKDRQAIIVTEIPYQVNKSNLIEKIAECVRDKRIEGISDLRDESDRDGVRVVIELKRDAMEDVVLNQLYRFTGLQTSFGINTLALTGGKPEQMDLKTILQHFIDFREVVITRRTKFLLRKARDRAHILVGLVIAVTNIDEIVAIIRGAKSPAQAREKLRVKVWNAKDILPYLKLLDEATQQLKGTKYTLSEEQVKAILELRLHRLTALGREEIGGELEELSGKIREFLKILTDRDHLFNLLSEELKAARDEFATPRKTQIIEGDFGQFEDEDLIKREEMVVTVTQTGYIKRVALSTYRAQRRGGKGRAGMSTKEEDILSSVFVASTHTPVLFFSSAGIVYKLKVWKLPLSSPTAKGKAIINLLPLTEGDTIETILPLPEDEESWGNFHIMLATKKGIVRRNILSDFSNVKSNGKIAIRMPGDDRLVSVQVCTEDDDVLLAARQGKSIRFSTTAVRLFKGRTAYGVRGMRLKGDDRIISMTILGGQKTSMEDRTAYLRAAPWKSEPGKPALSKKRMIELEGKEQFILTVTVNGFGKRTSSFEYSTKGRGGMGMINIVTSERNGPIVASFPVEEGEQIIMVTDQGKIIRTPIHTVRIAGRATQGVTLFDVAEGERVVSVAKLQEEEEAEDENGEEGENTEDSPEESSEESAKKDAEESSEE